MKAVPARFSTADTQHEVRRDSRHIEHPGSGPWAAVGGTKPEDIPVEALCICRKNVRGGDSSDRITKLEHAQEPEMRQDIVSLPCAPPTPRFVRYRAGRCTLFSPIEPNGPRPGPGFKCLVRPRPRKQMPHNK